MAKRKKPAPEVPFEVLLQHVRASLACAGYESGDWKPGGVIARLVRRIDVLEERLQRSVRVY
jgi:hypothetical protein